MKKTLTINLSGTVFTIDEDAYDVLQQYLHVIEKHFPKEEDREILSDIETRIAELFTDMLRSGRVQVVNIENVQSVIATLGNPDQFDENDDFSEVDEGAEAESGDYGEKDKDSKQSRRQFRKLYRDTDNVVIGGVCSGLASYIGCDATAARVIVLLIVIFTSGWALLAYLALWLFVPKATSTAQKLEMQGIEPSIENIRKFVESEGFRTTASRIGSGLGQVFRWIFRVAAILVGIVMVSIGLFIVALLFTVVLAVIEGTGSWMFDGFLSPFFHTVTPVFWVWIVALLAVILIPVVSIIMVTIRLVRHKDSSLKPYNTTAGWVWFGIWIVAAIALACSSFISISNEFGFGGRKSISVTSAFDVTEERLRNEPFNSLNVQTMYVTLRPDTVSFVEISGTERGLRSAVAKISDNTLELSLDQKVSVVDNPKVVVHYTELNAVSASSAASVYMAEGEVLRSPRLDIQALSSSDIDLNVECKEMEIGSSSGADIELDGKTGRVTVKASSGADIDMRKLHTGYANVSVSSGADIELRADTVSLQASSGGDIRFYGKPLVLKSNASSGGSIVHKN